MIDDNKIVKLIESKTGGKSGTYWTVTWQDDKRDNIFNADWLPLLEQSQQEGRMLHFTKEKEGKYYNIKTLEFVNLDKPPTTPPPMTHPNAPAIPPKQETKHLSGPETGMWWNQLGEMLRARDIDTTTPPGKAMRVAYYAEMIRVLGITVKEVQPAKKLTDVAKAMGAEEIPDKEG